MTPRSDLHQLVHSMTAHEIRYFRMFGRMQVSQTGSADGQWNYLQLFDALLEQEEYDEPALKAAFAGTKIAHNLAVEKHYLYLQLLKALRSFRLRKRKDLQVREMLDGVVLLMERELTEPAWNMLRRVLRAAEKLDMPAIQLEAHLLERRLAKLRNRKSKDKDLAALDSKGDHLMRQVSDEYAINKLYDRFAVELQKTFTDRGTASEAILKEFKENPQLDEPDGEESFRTRILRLQILASIAHREKDTQKAHHYFKAIAEAWEAHPDRIVLYPVRFLNVLSNYLAAVRDHPSHQAEFMEVLAKIRIVRSKFKLQEISGESREMYHEMLFYTDQGQLETATLVADKLATLIKASENELPINYLLPATFNLAVVFFLAGKFKESLHWCNYIINLEATDKRQTLQQIARIFQLLIHYQLDNLDLLDYLIRNTKARFRKNNTLYQFEFTVIKTIKGLLKDSLPESETILLTALEDTLKKGFPSTMTGREETLIWIKSRLLHRPILEIAQYQLSGESQE